jgi:hypothetical protein
MTQSQRFPDYYVSVSIVIEIMKIGSAEASSLDCDLDFRRRWSSQLAMFLK